MRKTLLLLGIALVLAAYALYATFLKPDTPLLISPTSPEEGCRLLGRVLDASGAPLPFAAVRARIVSPGTAHESLPATTGEDGTFALRLFPAHGQWIVLVQPAGRPGFTAGAPVTALPDQVVRITIHEPPEVVPPDEEPSITGEVLDSRGRLLTGIPVMVTTKTGHVLARTTSGEKGRFEFRIQKSPVIVRIDRPKTGQYTVPRLPKHDIDLILNTGAPDRGKIVVDFELTEALPNEEARIRIYDNVGQEKVHVLRPVREAPHELFCDHGTLDIRVEAAGHAGALQGFDFRPDKRVAKVRLTPAASIRGRLSREVESRLFSRSPTLVPMSRAFQESDGIHQILRGLWERRPAGREFTFENLPAGLYRLRFLDERTESAERIIRLKGGEDLDLGLIELEEATAKVTVTLADREPPNDEELEFGYFVQFYETGGQQFTRRVRPGFERDIVFEDIPAGLYRIRTERMLDGSSHTRRVGWDRKIQVEKGAHPKVTVQMFWRY